MIQTNPFRGEDLRGPLRLNEHLADQEHTLARRNPFYLKSLRKGIERQETNMNTSLRVMLLWAAVIVFLDDPAASAGQGGAPRPASGPAKVNIEFYEKDGKEKILEISPRK